MISKFDLDEAIDRCQAWLSFQGPLKDFVCQNPLMAFQHLPFHDGVRHASKMHGSYRLMCLSFYRDAWRQGQISQAAIDQVISWYTDDSHARDELYRDLHEYPVGSSKRPDPLSACGIRAKWRSDFGVNLEQHATPVMMRILGSFLDQGIAAWTMPDAEHGLFQAVSNLNRLAYKSFHPFNQPLALKLLSLPPRESILESLKLLVTEESLFERYIYDLLMSLPGWSAMIRQLEKKPAAMVVPRPVSMLEYIAIALILDVAVVASELGQEFAPLPTKFESIERLPCHPAGQNALQMPKQETIAYGRIDLVKTIWHEALEWSLYHQAFRVVASSPPTVAGGDSTMQAVFCIDDRECSLRRYLETTDQNIETFGTAGFFGMDFMYQGHEEWMAVQNCPIVLSPKHLIKVLDESGSAPPKSIHKFARLAWLDRASHTLLGGWLIAHSVGALAGLRLLKMTFWPKPDDTSSSAVLRKSDSMPLSFLRQRDSIKDRGFEVGYTPEELADRIEGQLRSTGLIRRLAPLVVMVSHGSSTVNNPHYAAYDCGACMGKPGAPNARVFAAAANLPAVRDVLAARGILIPAETRFVAALHDTTRDDVIYFDTDGLSKEHQGMLRSFQQSMARALELNAKERCRRFERVAPKISPKRARKIVRLRSISLFEPRPELTHTANALAIVGRRTLTKNFFLDRRSFLNSYDPTLDPDGVILSGLLGAVVPVCGGINLTYFFSRMDNIVMGAGTKLPHNVVGLLGVSNGVEGDLLVGLPKQMIELHEPIRLLVLIEQEPDVALHAAKRNPAIFQWIENNWVWYGSVSPTTKKTYIYRRDSMHEINLKDARPLAVETDSRPCFEGHHTYVPFAAIRPSAEGGSHA